MTNEAAVKPLESAIRWHPASKPMPEQGEHLLAYRLKISGNVSYGVWADTRSDKRGDVRRAMDHEINGRWVEVEVTHWATMPEYPHPQQPTPVVAQS